MNLIITLFLIVISCISCISIDKQRNLDIFQSTPHHKYKFTSSSSSLDGTMNLLEEYKTKSYKKLFKSSVGTLKNRNKFNIRKDALHMAVEHLLATHPSFKKHTIKDFCFVSIGNKNDNGKDEVKMDEEHPFTIDDLTPYCQRTTNWYLTEVVFKKLETDAEKIKANKITNTFLNECVASPEGKIKKDDEEKKE